MGLYSGQVVLSSGLLLGGLCIVYLCICVFCFFFWGLFFVLCCGLGVGLWVVDVVYFCVVLLRLCVSFVCVVCLCGLCGVFL